MSPSPRLVYDPLFTFDPTPTTTPHEQQDEQNFLPPLPAPSDGKQLPLSYDLFL
jgi:hypothetical protein